MNPILLFLNNFWEIREPRTNLRKNESFWEQYGTIILSIGIPVLLVLAIIIFLLICIHIGGTESGLWYNGDIA